MPYNSLLPSNHAFIGAERDMRAFAEAMVKPYGITYFGYLRVYDDGTAIILTNMTENLVSYWSKHQAPIISPTEDGLVSDKFNYLVLPRSSQSEKVLHEVKMHLNVGHFLNMVERHVGYVELYAYGTSGDNDAIVNFYLNNIAFLESIKISFKENSATLLKSSDKNKVLVPISMLPVFKGLNHARNDAFVQTKKLSKRQFDCVKQLTLGNTIKEVAQNLDLSPRTVEHYIEAVKTKLGCRSKAEVIKIMFKHLSVSLDKLN